SITNVTQDNYIGDYSSNELVDLESYAADTDTLRFEASEPAKGSTSTFNDLCLPLGLSNQSECSGGTYTIEMKAICLFDPASDDDCPELSETSYNDDLPWYKSLYVSAK